MPGWSKFLLFSILCLIGQPQPLMADGQKTKVWFEHQRQGESLSVSVYSQGDSETSLRYSLSTSKYGPSGKSKLNQSGNFTATSSSPTRLATQQLSLHANDRCEMTVKIYRGDEELVSANFQSHGGIEE